MRSIPHDIRHLILPGLCQGDQCEFRDSQGQARVVTEGDYSLIIEAELPVGLMRFDVELRPGTFDVDGLYCEMTEYPSGEFVRTGPWDLAMDDPPRMQIPTLDVHLDGEHFGNMWFEMPGSQDIRQRKLGGVFVLPVTQAGMHTIRIVVPEYERNRLNLSMLEFIQVRPDDRDFPDVQPLTACRADRPWLFLGGRELNELRRCRPSSHSRPWRDMVAAVDHYFSTGVNLVRGCPILASAAFMALLDGPESAAFGKLKSLLESRRERCAFLETHGKFMFLEGGEELYSEKRRWLMGHGWNDYGFSWVLLDYACVLQWLGPWLPAELRGWIEEQLLRYGRELYRFIIFQRQYAGAQGGYNAHVNVPMLTVAALGAVLPATNVETRDWFRFGVGRMRDSFPLLPRDYTGTHLVWNPPWVLLMVEFLRDCLGECHRQEPFMQELSAVLWRTDLVHNTGGFSSLEGFYRWQLTAYCASQLQNKEAQWYYRRLCDTLVNDVSPDMAASYLHVLWHTDQPGCAPDEERRDQSVLWPATGFALLQTNYDKPRLAVRFQCGHWSGTPHGLTVDRYAGCGIADPFPHGGFEVWMRGVPILRQMSDYRMSFRCGNFVTVDDDGFFMEDGWVVGRTDMSRAAFLRQARMGREVCYLDGINTLSYAPELALIGSRRQVFFDCALELVVIVDEIESCVEHNYALHLHAARIEDNGDNRFFCFSVPTPVEVGPLHVHCLPMPAMKTTICTGSIVYPYPYGVTQVKGGPKLSGDHRAAMPTLDRKIVCTIGRRTTAARFVTVASPHPLTCDLQENRLRVASRLGDRQLHLQEHNLVYDSDGT